MTRRGFGLFILICASAVGLFATGNTDFLTASVVLALLFAISFLTAVIARPVCKLETDEFSAPRAKTRSVRVVVGNRGLLPAFRYRIKPALLKEGEEIARLGGQTCDIPGGRGRVYNFELQVTCPHRGEYAVEAGRPGSEDLFGFFRFKRASCAPLVILSLPGLIKSPRLPGELNASTANGDSNGRRGGPSGEQQPETRNYQTGDPMRSIHWKQSVRRKKLATRLRGRISEPEYMLLLNTEPLADADTGGGHKAAYEEEYEDAMCECALSVAYTLLSRRCSAALMPCGLHRSSPEALPEYARALASLAFDGPADAAVLSTLMRERNVPDTMFYISAAYDAGGDVSSLLKQIEARGCKVVRLCPQPFCGEDLRLSGFAPYPPAEPADN